LWIFGQRVLGCFCKNPHGKQGYTNADQYDNQTEKQDFFVHKRCFLFLLPQKLFQTDKKMIKLIKFNKLEIRHVRIQ